MVKRNEPKKLCWNCDGNVSLQLTHCPYCNVDLTSTEKNQKEDYSSFKRKAPLEQEKRGVKIPKPPYASLASSEQGVSEEEWQKSLEKVEKEQTSESGKKEMIALLLLLPGVVFLLFGVLLMLFSQNGVLTLKWNESFAYFYFMGALPLLFLGWRLL
jgi:hypothetical protein